MVLVEAGPTVTETHQLNLGRNQNKMQSRNLELKITASLHLDISVQNDGIKLALLAPCLVPEPGIDDLIGLLVPPVPLPVDDVGQGVVVPRAVAVVEALGQELAQQGGGRVVGGLSGLAAAAVCAIAVKRWLLSGVARMDAVGAVRSESHTVCVVDKMKGCESEITLPEA